MAGKKLRILVSTSTFPRWKNDTEPSFVFDLCRYLHDRGVEIDVLAPHAHGAEKHEVLDGINVHRYRYFFSKLQKLTYTGGILANLKRNPANFLIVPLLLLFQALAFYRRIRAENYHLVHAHWLIPQGLVCAVIMCLAGKRAPALICTSHGGDLYALDGALFRLVKTWITNRCVKICVVSNAMKKKALELGIPEEKVSVMPMGVDLVTQFRTVSAVERKDNRLIFVGRLVEKKGVNYLIDAMVKIIKRIPDAELLIVGDGPLRPALEQQARGLQLNGHINFMGSIQHQNLPRLYSSASIAIVPSIISRSGDQEGLGLVLIEAMGCECAVIASGLEAIKDVIDAGTSMLVPPGSAGDLADAIIHLINNPEQRLQMAERGRAKVTKMFDWRTTGENYFQLINNLTGR